MKISVETYALRERFGDEESLRRIAAAGFGSFDYSFYWTDERNDMLGDDHLSRAEHIRDLAASLGLTCGQTHAPFDITAENRFDESDPLFVRLIRSIEAASVMGAANIVVHRIETPEGTDELELNRGFYRSLIPYCERYGIKVAVENLFTFREGRPVGVLDNPEILKGFIASLGSDCFSVCVDVGHAHLTGTPPQELISGLDGGILGALHIHDNDGSGDNHRLPWCGGIDWDAVTDSLARIGYDGEMTLEIFGSLSRYPSELTDEALRFAARIASRLAEMVEEKKK